jgi:DNA primase
MNGPEVKKLLESIGIRHIVERGQNLMACCPFHGERNPSWGISIHPPHSHGCFSCGAKGNLFTLLVKIGGYSLERAADICQNAQSETDFIEFTMDAPVNDMETIDRQLLYPYSLTKRAKAYLASRGIKAKTAKKTELAYDPYLKRVLFPWHYHGKLVGVTGRSIDPREKVKTLPYYDTKKGQCLYLPNQKIIKGPLVVVEGEIDALRVYQAGFHNVGALGFGRLSKAHARLIEQSEATEVILFVDDDNTGSLLLDMVRKMIGDRVKLHHVDYAPWRRRYRDEYLVDPDFKLDPGAFKSDGHLRLALNSTLKRHVSWPEF